MPSFCIWFMSVSDSGLRSAIFIHVVASGLCMLAGSEGAPSILCPMLFDERSGTVGRSDTIWLCVALCRPFVHFGATCRWSYASMGG